MILTKTSTNTDKSSSSQERLISLSPNKNHAILFRDLLPVLQSHWIAVYAAKRTTQCRSDPLRASVRVWLRETSAPLGEVVQELVLAKTHANLTPQGMLSPNPLLNTIQKNQDKFIINTIQKNK